MTDFTELPQFTLRTDLIRLLTEEFCRGHRVVVLGPVPPVGRGPVPLGMLNPGDDKTAEEAEREIGRPVRRIQLNVYEIDTAIGFGYGKSESQKVAADDSEDGDKEKLMLNPNCRIRFHPDQSVGEILEDTLSEAVQRRATDIHIETYENDIDLRFRIDGVLMQVTTPLSLANVKAFINRLKVLSNLDLSDRRNPQDGRLNAQYTEADGSVRRISFRAAILPGPFGEDVVLRVLDERRTCPPLEDLGMNPRILSEFKDMITSPGGLILVTGPTASGKTTTLYAAIHSISLTGKKILTVEDPIEFELPKVNQKQVTPTLSFADYARAFMRQNPDVLMIGEIRDEETANIALKASQMGHLVFSTLHTPDALSAIGRLVMLGLDKSLILSTLLGVLSQRLIRKICPSCRTSAAPARALLAKVPSFISPSTLARGNGCRACGQSGYYDRTGVFELIRIDDRLRETIALALDVSLADVAHAIKGERMLEDALNKVTQGITTLEEVVRVVPFLHHASRSELPTEAGMASSPSFPERT